VYTESRSAHGAANLAAEGFGRAAEAAAEGDGFGVGFYLIIGAIGVGLLILYILAGDVDDNSDFKRRSFNSGMLSFSF